MAENVKVEIVMGESVCDMFAVVIQSHKVRIQNLYYTEKSVWLSDKAAIELLGVLQEAIPWMKERQAEGAV